MVDSCEKPEGEKFEQNPEKFAVEKNLNSKIPEELKNFLFKLSVGYKNESNNTD